MTRRGLLALSLLGLSWASSGCGSPKSAFDAKLDRGQFSFVLGEGTSWHGYDVVRISSTGDCWYTFSELDYQTEAVVWRSARFSIPAETLRALRQALNDVGFFQLESEYKGPENSSRSQWFFKVRIGEQKKAVFLDNDFPPAAVKLERFIAQHVLGPHREEFKTAAIIRREWAEEKPTF